MKQNIQMQEDRGDSVQETKPSLVSNEEKKKASASNEEDGGK